MAQGGKDIINRVCKIRQQAPGNVFETTGSACILEMVNLPRQRSAAKLTSENQTFLVTTSQVMLRLSGYETAWQAEFLPRTDLLSRIFNTEECYNLTDVACHEVQVAGHETYLILISTESLHEQKYISSLRENEFRSRRSLPCIQKESESELQATSAKQEQLFCYVLTETASSNKFSLKCYLLKKDERGSYFLQPHGNEAKLRKLEDFQQTESPKGSVILNSDGYVVGLLAFGDKSEVVPLFLPRNLQVTLADSNELSHADGDDSEASQSSGGNRNEREANQNQYETNLFPPSHLKKDPVILAVFLDPTSSGLEVQRNEQSIANQQKPSEPSYVSQLRESSASHNQDQTRSNGDGEEERMQTRSNQRQAQGRSALENGHSYGNNQGPEAKRTQLRRSYSEQQPIPETLRTIRLLSEKPPIPLEPGALVAKVIINEIHVMDQFKNHLDTSCKGIQNWRYLADLNDVPLDEQRRWQSGERHSKTEKMFEVLACTNPDLLIGTLTQHLRNHQINNVAKYITSLHLDENMTVVEFFESEDPSTTGRVLIMLDLTTDGKWQSLGIAIGLEAQKLKQIRVDCANQQENPALHVINIVYTSQPRMIIGQFQKKLTDIERSDVARKLDKLPEKCTIDELVENLDLMREVTSMLNGPDNSPVKNYKDLAHECGIPREKYQSLQPPCADSPTQKTIEEICQRKPTFTVEELFTNLRDMKRLDVIEAISTYYEKEDMRAMKRKLRISDE